MIKSGYLRFVLLLIACSLSAATAAQTVETKTINIPAGDLVVALDALAKQTGAEFIYSTEQLKGLTTKGVAGTMTAPEGLRRLIEGSGAVIRRDPTGAALIERGPPSDARPPSPARPPARPASEPVAAARELETVTVTGTNIRGLQESASPLLVLDSTYIQSTGYASFGQLVESLPQNFGGGASQDTLGTNGSVGNNGFGDAANLRGFGPGSTLVLLNGQRLAPGGNSGEFVDISMIPLSAIKRVEVLTDGASAIYGADAVGGVINVITREDYEGGQTTLRLGAATEGGATERQVSQSYATAWDGGNAMAVAEYYRRTPVLAGDRDFAGANDPTTTLLPEQKRASLYSSANQDLGSYVTLFGNLLYTRRDSEHHDVLGSDEPIHESQSARNEAMSSAFGARFTTDGTWNGELVASYSRYALDALLDREGELTVSTVDTRTVSLDGRVDGTVLTLPGGGLSAALGAGYRRENVTTIFDDSLPGRSVRVAFGELFVPIVGAGNRVPGIEALDLDVAARYEDFSDFNGKVTPKYGVRWVPLNGLTVRGTWGKSFKAPTLAQLANGDETLLAFIPSDFGLDIPGDPLTLLRTQKAMPDLQAERSRNRTLGFDFKPDFTPFKFSLTWYDIDYTGRIADPADEFFNSPAALGNLVVHDPSAAFVASLLARATSVLDLTGGQLSPTSVGLFADLSLANIAADRQSGFDFRFDYPIESDRGQFDASLQGTYITRYDRKVTEEAPTQDALNVLYGPVDLRLRAGLSWTRDAWSAAAFANYVDSYRVHSAPDSARIASWTTFDLHLAYEFEPADHAFLHGLSVALNIQNFFNRAPPFVAAPAFINGNTGYDPNNADPLGRFVALTVTKKW